MEKEEKIITNLRNNSKYKKKKNINNIIVNELIIHLYVAHIICLFSIRVNICMF